MQLGRDWFVVDGRTLLFGARSQLEKVLARPARPAPELGLSGETFLAARGTVANRMHVGPISLRVSTLADDTFLVAGTELETEAAASSFAARLEAARPAVVTQLETTELPQALASRWVAAVQAAAVPSVVPASRRILGVAAFVARSKSRTGYAYA